MSTGSKPTAAGAGRKAARKQFGKAAMAQTQALSAEQKQEILAILSRVYHGAASALEFGSPFQLLVATALAAQTTDVRVNMVTRALFERYPDAASMAGVSAETLIPYIKSLGLYRTKAKNIAALAAMLAADFGGRTPETREELMKLPGVGRKTANVVLAGAFQIPAMAVDTHVFRVSNRTGLAPGKNPVEVEEGLCRLIPREDWRDAHHWLIWHGRRVCKAPNPACADCPLSRLCPGRRHDRSPD